MDVKAFYSGSKQNHVPEGGSSIFRQALDAVPRYMYDPVFGIMTNNPLSALENNYDYHQKDLFQCDVNLNVPILENLTFTSKFSYRHRADKTELFDPQDPFFEHFYESAFMTDQAEASSSVTDRGSKDNISEIDHSYNKNSKLLWDNILDYNVELNMHRIGFTAVSSIESYTGTSLLASAIAEIEYVNSAAYPDAAAFWEEISGGPTNWTGVGFIGRLNYNYDERYLLEGSMRADASSNFAKENRWGYFPSALAGWRISQESFLDNMPWINQLKIRVSWGNAGNSRIGTQDRYTIMHYGYQYALGPEWKYGVVDGIAPRGVGNPGIQWEKTTTYNVGLDLGLFQHIYASADYYRRYTYDMLLRVPVVSSSGMNENGDYPLQNGGDVLNKGGDLEVGYKTFRGDFRFDLSANISYYRNEVLALGVIDDPVYGGNVGKASMGNITRTEVGGEIGAFYGYRVDGVYNNVDDIVNGPQGSEAGVVTERYLGRLKFVDLNQDGQLDDADKTIIGSAHPDFTYGLNLRMDYKGFNLKINWMGVQGIDVFQVMKYDVNFMRDNSNIRADLMGGEIYNHYEAGELLDGSPFYYPEEYLPMNRDPYAEPSIDNRGQSDANFNTRPSSYFIEDNSYLRLSDVVL
jgi:TonB-linked SusC/RagA family outer membrane protein